MRWHLSLAAFALFTTACGAADRDDDAPGGTLSTEITVGDARLELVVTFDASFTAASALEVVERDARAAFEQLAAEDPAALRSLAEHPPARLVLSELPPAGERDYGDVWQIAAWSVDVGKCRYFFSGLSYQGYMCTG